MNELPINLAPFLYAILLLVAGGAVQYAFRWFRDRGQDRDDLRGLAGRLKRTEERVEEVYEDFTREIERFREDARAEHGRHRDRMAEFDKRIETARLELQNQIARVQNNTMPLNEIRLHLTNIQEKVDRLLQRGTV